MSRPFIVLGDKTDHGGEVIEAAATTGTHGRRIARVGDKVTCPQRNHGPTVIVTGDPTMLIDGKPVARHGDKTACGATLIASQSVGVVESGSIFGQSSRHDEVSVQADKHALLEQQPYDEQVNLTERLAAGLPYYIETKDGQIFSGRTGSDGKLPRIKTYGEGTYTVLWGDEALQKIEGNAP